MATQRLMPLILAATLFPALAQADTILGWRAGANAWQQYYEGDVQSGPSKIDLEDDLGYDDETGYNLYLALEHPVPVLPNIMVQRTKIDADARGDVTGFIFEGIIYSGEVRSSLDVSHTDATLYYELLDNWVNLDLGITGRVFDNGVEITDVSTGITGSLDIDYVIPLVYAQARIDLPLTGLSLGVEANGISYDDDSLYDVKVNLAYEFAFGLGIEAGYRNFDFDYEDDDEFADVTIDGAYAGVVWDF
ncbi:MAG: TIGR04219 family outer membrane beta-barrel protein [Halieaceae bacterium]